MDFITTFFQKGGFFMYALAFSGVISLALIFERIYTVYFSCSIGANRFMKKIYEQVKKRNWQEAHKIASKSSAPLAKVILTVIQNHDKEFTKIKETGDEAYLVHSPQIKRNTNLLPILAQVSTLLGLLGTIVGLIVSFESIASTEMVDKTPELAAGISMAMNTTGVGLLIAVFNIIVYFFITLRAEKLIDDIESNVVRFVNFLISMQGG